jgi:hypothetical protein
VIARVRASHQQRTPALALSVGIARFDPLDPTSIDELLEEARRDMNQPASQLGFSVEVNRWSMGNLAPHSI